MQECLEDTWGKLITPKLLQSEILDDLHAGVLGGHLGETDHT